MSTETERQEFEAWAVDEGFDIVEGRMGGYLMADTAAAWKAWQVQSAKASESSQQAEAEPVASEHVPEATRTAPEVIWLQHGDEEHHAEEPFPVHQGDASWCNHQVFPADVKYVRADLAAPVVPDMKIATGYRDSKNQCWAMGWNDCRAEMLAGLIAAAPQPEQEDGHE